MFIESCNSRTTLTLGVVANCIRAVHATPSDRWTQGQIACRGQENRSMTPRHHLIPEAYVQHFAKAEPGRKFPIVALADRDNSSRKILKSVDKACTEVGFYRIETDDLAREEDRQGHDPGKSPARPHAGSSIVPMLNLSTEWTYLPARSGRPELSVRAWTATSCASSTFSADCPAVGMDPAASGDRIGASHAERSKTGLVHHRDPAPSAHRPTSGRD
ncbi:DUF4238 domain-containing protein [Nocardia salmonicida]|uniref:DUF4238 domain-containing protein n=1 Tax=Nocardia salmonicida TaxID=53431 RepID=UPI000AF29819